MKKLISSILVAALAVLPVTFTGCATPEQTQAAVILVSLAAKNAAYFGVSADLKAHPERREAYIQAKNALNLFAAFGANDTEQLIKILRSLPVGEFQGEDGLMIVGDIVVIVDAANKVFKLKDSKALQEYAIPVAKAVSAGITLALDNPVADVPLNCPGDIAEARRLAYGG
jgi:hypothetical protein